MKEAEWKRAVRSSVEETANWRFRRDLAYLPPKDAWVLTGALASGSAFDKGVYVYRVVMPLYIPFPGIYLTWSDRVASGRKVGSSDPRALEAAIREATRPFPTDDDLLRKIAGNPDHKNWTNLQDSAYAAVLLGSFDGARALLEPVVSANAEYPHEEEIVSRARTMAEHIDAGEHSAARAQLQLWRTASLGSLGLNDAAPAPR